MDDTENPDIQDWNPDTDSQLPIPVPEPKNEGILRKAKGYPSKEDKEAPEKRIREWLQFIVNFILAVVGVLAVCYYSGQLAVMRGQLAEIVRQFPEIQAQRIAAQDQLAQAKKDSDASAVATAMQIEILRKQLGLQEYAERLGQRAWVEIGQDQRSAFYSASPPTGTVVKIAIYPKNVGKTPAYDVRCFAHQVIGGPIIAQSNVVEGIQQSMRRDYPDAGSETLASGQQSEFPCHSGGFEPGSIGHGLPWIYHMVGRIEYFDMFGAFHWTNFCYFVADKEGNLSLCRYGNGEDSSPKDRQRPN